MPTDSSTLTFGNLRITPDQIMELQDNRPILTIPRPNIRSLHLRHGTLARHPIAQLTFGIVLIIATSIILIAGVHLAINGQIMVYFLLPGAFTLLGFWILYDALRRGHYLEVWTDTGMKKIAVGKTLPPQAAADLDTILQESLNQRNAPS